MLTWRVAIGALGGLAFADAAAAQPAGDYPRGVVVRGLQAVWDSQRTAGVNEPLINRPAAHCAKLPGGCGVISGTDIYLRAGGAHTLSNWDFSGYTVWIDGSGTWLLDQVKFDANRPVGRLLSVGANSGSPMVTCDRCTFDLGDLNNLFEAGVYNKGTLILRRSWMNNAAMGFLSQPSGGSIVIEDSYLGRIGQRPAAGAHLEAIHAWNGSLSITRTMVDLRGGHGAMAPKGADKGGLTGAIYPEGAGGPISWSLVDSIIAGVDDHGGFWTIQYGDNAHATSGVVRGNVLSAGRSGHIYKGARGALSGSDNVDLKSGRPIRLP